MINNEKGSILVFALMALVLVLFTVVSLLGGAQLYYSNSSYSANTEIAAALAEAGVDKAIASLNKLPDSYTGEQNIQFGGGELDIDLVDKNPTTKTITAKAYIPNEENPKVTRTVQIDVARGAGTAFNYALQAGEGGILMGESTTINGSVYSNGPITMSLTNEITGDVSVAAGTSPVPDQEKECQASCANYIFHKSVSSQLRMDVAQSFKPSQSQVLNKVALKLKKIGDPLQIPVVRILRNNNGVPDKNNPLASAILAPALVTDQFAFVEVAFSTPPALSQGLTYWIVIDTCANQTNCNSAGNYWVWSQNLLEEYANGTAKWSPRWNPSGTPVWNAINSGIGDLDFKVYMGGVTNGIDGWQEFNWADSVIGGDAYANVLDDLFVGEKAYYQAVDNVMASTQTCDVHPYPPSCNPNSPDPPVMAMPLSDGTIQGWKNLAASYGVYSGDISSCPSSIERSKIEGSVHFPPGCTVIVSTPIWITGDLVLDENVNVKLKPNYGTSSGVIIVDGKIVLSQNDELEGSGTPGSFMILLSEYDNYINNTNCDLLNSSGCAIQLLSDGNNGFVYANRGAIWIGANNNLTSITGASIMLASNTTITYDEGLVVLFFSLGPQGEYSLIKGTYQFK